METEQEWKHNRSKEEGQESAVKEIWGKEEDMVAWEVCKALLLESGIHVGKEQEEAIERHLKLIREWHRVVAVVSQGDLDGLLRKHVIDSLSLAPYVALHAQGEGRLLDIGSGGGFPALCLKVVMPEWEVVCVERSFKKVGFLRKVIGALGLHGVSIVQGEFPRGVGADHFDVITGRAVEEPKGILRAVAGLMEGGGVFLCQTGNPDCFSNEKFHVEHIEDRWTKEKLRRGSLDIVRRRL